MKAFITFIFFLSATVDANEDGKMIAELREKLNKIAKEANQTTVIIRYIFDMQNFKSKIKKNNSNEFNSIFYLKSST